LQLSKDQGCQTDVILNQLGFVHLFIHISKNNNLSAVSTDIKISASNWKRRTADFCASRTVSQQLQLMD